jgi:mono/diheme cytochrome c family protein
MRTAAILGGLLVAAAAASTLVFGQPKSTPQVPAPSVTPPAGAGNDQVARGRYLVGLGDCVACHTRQGGERFSGGRPVATPFGTLLSANITPDPETGIGDWTADQFYRALHEGIDDEGKHLYPAFPYNYYTGITREDSDAMFAYLRSVPAVRHDFERNKLSFPFNQRWLLTFWNWMFLHKGPYRADPAKSVQWNRGAYLVQTLGHCGACHTPMNFLGAPKQGESFRGGHFAPGWFAPDITANRRTGVGGWTDQALLTFLREGTNVHSAAAGEMGEVVAFSTSQMNDADLQAVVAYLRSVPASPDAQVKQADATAMNEGKAIWEDSCSACHRMDASGVPRFFPPLKADANVQQSDPTTVLHYILGGTRKTPTDRAPTPLSMPAYDWKLDDQQVAAVATYVRNSWGNAAAPVTADEVAKLRKELRSTTTLPAQHPPATDVAHPGANTLTVPGSDSRDNGTAHAGSAARDTALIPAASKTAGTGGGSGAGSASSGSGAGGTSSAGGGNQQEHGKGHPAGVPTPGPG